MRALRWLWDIGLPAAVSVCCIFAMFGSILLSDDPNHVWLAYLFGVTWFGDRAIDAWAQRQQAREYAS